jgi:hypothetical protein
MNNIDFIFVYITGLIVVYILGIAFIAYLYSSNSIDPKEEFIKKTLNFQLDMLFVIAVGWPLALPLIFLYFIFIGLRHIINRA